MFQEETNDAVALLQQLIAIPSYSREETAVADFLEKYIEMKGYVANRKDNNIWIMSPGFELSKPTLLLNSHLDTVKPVSGWIKTPFLPLIEEGKLYGLGSNDAGASVVSLLQVFFLLTQKQQSYNLIFAASAEEEVSGQNGIESLMKELPEISFAIVGEPTGMQPAVAEKGLMVLDGVVTGKAGHAARDEGDNAIYKAIPAIEWFHTFVFPKVSELLGPVKMTVTQVNAGTQHNVVPDKCTFVVDVRSNELYSNAELLDEIRQQVNCNITPRSTRLGSTATPVGHPVVAKCLEMGLMPFGSPTLSDQTLLTCPSLKMGPGQSARSHTADEFIFVEEINEALTVYFELLDGLDIE